MSEMVQLGGLPGSPKDGGRPRPNPPYKKNGGLGNPPYHRKTVTAEEAAGEKVRREKARRHLVDYSEYVAPFYKAARHHRLVAEKLELVERYITTGGEEGIGRLMIFEPPRHGKTEQVSRLFPSWLLGRHPDDRIILTSYGADLAQDDSRAVRAYVTGDRYKALFGSRSTVDVAVELSEDTRAKSNWDLAAPNRGGVFAAGIGGGITGKGANLLVIDDPFKNRDEAESESYRRKVLSWYQSAAYQRLEKGGAIVITHTRWHQEDLAGQLLTRMISDPLMADQWEIVFLPALALAEEEYCKDEAEFTKNMLRGIYIPKTDVLGRKTGEALWPEKFDEAALARIRANTSEAEFASLDQQQPRPAEGGFFDEKDLTIIERAPEGLKWVRYIDLALGETRQADWNTTVAEGMDKDGTVYLRDMLRVHELTNFEAQLKSWMTSDLEKGVVWGVEKVSFQSLFFRELMKDPRLANTAIRLIVPEGDKVSRARPLQTRAKQGKVKLVRGTWNQTFIQEALAFPGGTHDDQVDTASGGLVMLAKYGGERRKAGSHQG